MKQVLNYSYEYLNEEAVFYVKVGDQQVPVKMQPVTMQAWADCGGPLTYVRTQIRKMLGHDNFELVKSGGSNATDI